MAQPPRDPYYDMHMQMCIQDKVEKMSTPEKCVAYMAAKTYERSKSDPAALNTRISDLERYCQRATGQQTIGFYRDLCSGVNQAYYNAFQQQRK